MSALSTVNRRIRGTKRMAEVLAVLAKYGLQQIFIETGFERLLERGGELLGRERIVPTAMQLPTEVRLRKVLEELGPTFIKLGQILSTRPDLIPPHFAKEFEKLQSHAPTVEFAVIRARLEREFGDRLDELFATIDEEPLAAASMAQVHCATLKDGTEVVLKVLRPGIEAIIAADMDVLGELARITERHFTDLGYSPSDVVREFKRELEREVDMVHEGRSTERLAKLFEEDERVVFPKVYWEGTTHHVLTLERMNGRLLSAIDPRDMARAEREQLVSIGADAVFRMCLEVGFFHADPHSGNLMWLGDGRLCFLDCGMTGRVERRTTQQLAELVIAVVSGNLDAVIRVSVALSDADRSLKTDRTFRNDAWDFVARFQDVTMDSLDVPALLDGFFALLRRWHVRCPSDLVFLIKALTTIQGVGRRFAPEFDLIGHVQPHLERLVRSRYGFGAARHRIQTSLLKYLELAEDLPDEMRELLDQLRRREFSVNLKHQGLDRLNDDTIDQASRQVATAMVIAGLVIGSSILVHAPGGGGLFRAFAACGLVVAIGMMLNMVWIAFRRGRAARRRSRAGR